MAPDMRRAAPGEGGPCGDLKLPSWIACEITPTNDAGKALQRRFGLSTELALILAELAGLGPRPVRL